MRFTEAPAQAAPTAPKRWRKSLKAATAADCERLEQLPNVGPAMIDAFRLIGIEHPAQLCGAQPEALYDALNHARGQRQDPCVLDTLIAVTDFMRGAPPKPWWHYTAQRKLAAAPG